MRRWNGWGDEATVVDLPAHGEAFLAELIGSGQKLADATLADDARLIREQVGRCRRQLPGGHVDQGEFPLHPDRRGVGGGERELHVPRLRPLWRVAWRDGSVSPWRTT